MKGTTMNLLARIASLFGSRPPVAAFRGKHTVTYDLEALMYPSGTLNTMKAGVSNNLTLWVPPVTEDEK